MFSATDQSTAEPPAVMTSALIDAAAALETRLQDAKSYIEKLEREQQLAHQYRAQVVRRLLAIRRSHRTDSHAKTAQIIRDALTSLTADTPVLLVARTRTSSDLKGN